METLGIIQDIETLVSNQLQVVSYKWLSRNYFVSSNAAKRLLQEFVEKHGNGFEVVYVLAGWLKSDPSSYHIRLVSGPKLAEAKEEFDGNCSVGVYSVQACIPKDPAALWNAEFVQAEKLFKQAPMVENCLRDNRFCGISNSFVKRNVDGAPLSTESPQLNSEAVIGQPENSNWGSSSNSKREAKWAQMRREDEESDEEVQVRRNKQNIAASMAAAMVCQPTEKQPQWGGSVVGCSYKPRNRAMTHANLMNYFNPNSLYTEEDFKRRFRMRRHVFERLLRDVQQVNPYFRQKRDRAGRLGFSPHQKVTVALRMIVYGSLADSINETYGMSESTCIDTLEQFCDTIVQVYKYEYIREPNQEDMNRLICKAEDRGFPGMIRSLDCMHWDWKNCPTGWQ